MKKSQLTVIDFFSGSGGFSEGFRQQGFKVVKGIDYWEPAVRSHNLNHGLDDKPENVLDYAGTDSADVSKIEDLPDVDVLIGSPSCVTFSMANKGGKADKTEGIRLIEAYLRVIAVKKHKKGSQLKAWLMENVPNSGNYVNHDYTFTDLNLENWAISNKFDPSQIALSLNGVILNASDYGAPQHRSRFICGELISNGKFPLPQALSRDELKLKDIKSKMPRPNLKRAGGIWQDPNYPSLRLKANQISDHFYDSGLYITQWEQARYLKTMHPFMGKMSFPEDENKPSRTIIATRSCCTRESIIFKSEYNRTGHGEYRAPTIREAATLMGYPYTYQFFGSESLKWKLIGNSVSPQLSTALAKSILINEGRRPVSIDNIDFNDKINLYKYADNLNTFTPNTFDEKKIRKHNARFRRPLYKGQNTTIDLLNFRPGTDDSPGANWYVGVFYGTGSDHRHNYFDKASYRKLFKVLESEYELFDDYFNDLVELITPVSSKQMQDAYETDSDLTDDKNPLLIASRLQALCNKYSPITDKRIGLKGMEKPDFSSLQLLFMFSLCYLVYDCINSSLEPVNDETRYQPEIATAALATPSS